MDDFSDPMQHHQMSYHSSSVHPVAPPATSTSFVQNSKHNINVKLWSLRNKELKQLCKFCGFRFVTRLTSRMMPQNDTHILRVRVHFFLLCFECMYMYAGCWVLTGFLAEKINLFND